MVLTARQFSRIQQSQWTALLDITAPDGDIKIKENSVKKFINAVSFGLFFKENVDVTINASDAGSGVKSIESISAAK